MYLFTYYNIDLLSTTLLIELISYPTYLIDSKLSKIVKGLINRLSYYNLTRPYNLDLSPARNYNNPGTYHN